MSGRQPRALECKKVTSVIGIDWGDKTIRVGYFNRDHIEYKIFQHSSKDALPHSISYENGVFYPFSSSTSASSINYCLFNNIHQTYDFKDYGLLSCGAVISILLNYIKTEMSCQIAIVALRDHYGFDFKSLFLQSARDAGIYCVIVPSYICTITSYVNSKFDQDLTRRIVFDVGHEHSTLVIYESKLNTGKVIDVQTINIGGQHFTNKMSEFVRNEVRKNEEYLGFEIKGLSEIVNKMRSSFCIENCTEYSCDIELNNSETHDFTFLKDGFDRYVQNECNEITQFICHNLRKNGFKIVNGYANDVEICMAGNGYRLTCFRDAVNKVAKLSDTGSPSDTTWGATQLANQLILNERRIEIKMRDNTFKQEIPFEFKHDASAFLSPPFISANFGIVSANVNFHDDLDTKTSKGKDIHCEQYKIERIVTPLQIYLIEQEGTSYREFKQRYDAQYKDVIEFYKHKTNVMRLIQQNKTIPAPQRTQIAKEIRPLLFKDKQALEEIEKEIGIKQKK